MELFLCKETFFQVTKYIDIRLKKSIRGTQTRYKI